MAASSPRVRGDIWYLPWCRCDGEALWVPPPGLCGEPPTVGGSASRGPTNQESSVGVAHLGSSPTLTASKGGSSFIHPKIAVARNGLHVVTTSFGLTPLHPARPLACNERFTPG